MWWFFAWLWVFLLGMKLMEDTLLQYGVGTLKRIFRSFTDKKWKSIISGTVLASITQSSTIVSVMTVVFVGAGIMTLNSAVGIIIGANVGSTLLGILLGGAVAGSFKLSTFALPMLAIGGIGELIFKKKKKILFFTTLSLAFWLVFYGISLINSTVSAYAWQIDMSAINQWGIMGYFIIGILLTALMHSSDTMLILTLSFLSQWVIGLPAAIALMIGANIGTTVSAIEWSWSWTKEQKQVALSHFLFNVISALIWLPLTYVIVRLLQQYFSLPEQNVMALVVFDVWYNVIGALLFYPFIGKFVKLLEYIIRPSKDELILKSTHLPLHDMDKAIAAFRDDVQLLLNKVVIFNLNHMGIHLTGEPHQKEVHQRIYRLNKSVENEQLTQAFKVISTIEETLMQSVVKMYQKDEHDTSRHFELFSYREAIERMAYSAMTLHDTKDTIDELRATKSSPVNQYLESFTKDMLELYTIIVAYMQWTVTASQRKELRKSFDLIVTADERFLTQMSQNVSREVLSNRQLTELVHASQWLNRSHKAMIHTIDILYPAQKKA